MAENLNNKTIIDASGKNLGRLAVQLAIMLRGKDLPSFSANAFPKKQIVVFNVDQLKILAKKLIQKKYYRVSGYPGGLKERSLRDLMKLDSRRVLRRAVMGMLPKNRLRAQMIKNLKIHRGELSK